MAQIAKSRTQLSDFTFFLSFLEWLSVNEAGEVGRSQIMKFPECHDKLKENSFLQQEACENFKQKKIYNQIWSLETSDI